MGNNWKLPSRLCLCKKTSKARKLETLGLLWGTGSLVPRKSGKLGGVRWVLGVTP